MKAVYSVIFTPLEDEKDTILIEVPDLEILSEGFGMAYQEYCRRLWWQF